MEVFASDSGWNGASPGHGWAVLSDREDCLNPAFITGEKITACFGHQFSFDGASIDFTQPWDLLSFAAPPSSDWCERSGLGCSWSSSSHVLAMCSLTRKHNTAKTLVCIFPNLLQQLLH